MSSRRLLIAFWLIVFGAALLLAADTTRFIVTSGLYAGRPALPRAQTALRMAIIAGALAAGSSALLGFGLRGASLSAFRLLSHLAAYGLAAAVAGRALLQRAPISSARPVDRDA